MSGSFFIARRFVAAHRGYCFARFLTGIAVAGVGLGVFAMTLVLAVMGGFRTHLERKLLGFAPHVTIAAPAEADDLLARVREVLTTSGIAGQVVPMVEGEGIIQRADQPGLVDQGVKIRGLPPEAFPLLTSVQWHVFDPAHGLASDTVVVGSELALNLGALPEDDPAIQLVAPFGTITPAGELAPNTRRFRVAGAARTGFFEHDTKLVLLGVTDAARLLGEQATHRIVCYLVEPMQADVVAVKLRAALDPGRDVQTWQTQNRRLFGALRLERLMMGLLLVLIVLIASLSICGVVFMQVAWRRCDLAILNAVGTSRAGLRAIVLHIGTWIGCLGSLLGISAAVALSHWMTRHPIPLPASFYLDHLPIEMRWTHCAIIGIVGIGLAMAAALWPAWQGSQGSLETALRYE